MNGCRPLAAAAVRAAARCALLSLALWLRAAPFTAGKRFVLRLCLRLPRSPFSTVVRLRAAPRPVRLHCFQLDSEPHADIFNEWILLTGRWQPALTRWLEGRLKPGDTFVDVGAHYGYFTLLAAALVHDSRKPGRVIAVEASESTLSRLRYNVALNPILERSVRTVQAAASARHGVLCLYRHCKEPLYSTTVAGAGVGGAGASQSVWSILNASAVVQADATSAEVVSALASRDVWNKCEVQASRLDDILSEEEQMNARVIKIDVEGGEWSVICGMDRLLQHGRGDLEVVVELTPKWLRMQGISASQVISHMQGLGFKAYKLTEDYEISRCHPLGVLPRPCRMKVGEPLGCSQADIIFSREDADFL